MTRHQRGLFYLFLVTMGWGLSFCLMRALDLLVGKGWAFASGILSLRFLVAAVLLLAIMEKNSRRWPVWAEWRQGVSIALLGGAGMVLQGHGLSFTLASTCAFLTQGTTVIVPFWIAATRREIPNTRLLICIALVSGGIWILSGFDPKTFHLGFGETLTLLSCFLFAGMIFEIESPRDSGNDKILVTAVFLAATGVLGLLISLATGGTDFGWVRHLFTPGALITLLALACFSTTLAFLWMIKWQPCITATEAGILYCLEPVWAALTALFLPGWLAGLCGISYANEKITPALISGGGLVLLGCMLLAFSGPGAEKPPASS